MKSIPMSYKVISILLTIQLFAIESFSQNEIFTLKGRIFEANSKTQLLESNVEILSVGDSTVIASTNAILKQLSNVNRIINAQGIVETHNNIISQYVMLHMIYRFSKSSKKVLSR